MSAGLFGKLPAKRDFIGANASRRFLEAWEPWLQARRGDVEANVGRRVDRDLQSRADLALLARLRFLRRGDDRRLHAVGRWGRAAFPLAIFVGEGDASLAPPELEPNDAWFEAAEAVLLEALEPGATLERIAEKVAGLPAPALETANRQRRRSRATGRGRRSRPRLGRTFPPPFSPRVASGEGEPLRRRPSGGRSAAKAFPRSPCWRSACLPRPGSPTC